MDLEKLQNLEIIFSYEINKRKKRKREPTDMYKSIPEVIAGLDVDEIISYVHDVSDDLFLLELKRYATVIKKMKQEKKDEQVSTGLCSCSKEK